MKLRAFRRLAPGILAGACFVLASARADTTAGEGNPYAVISDRNVFHLNPPPAPPPPEQKTADAAKLLLSGFYKIGGSTRVLLAMPPKDQNAATKYFNLGPGERDSSVEVVKINAERGEVDVINSGTRMTLSFASNGMVAAAAPSHPAGGAPPVPGTPAGVRGHGLSALAAAAPPAPGANPALPSGSDAGSLAESGVASSYGGAIVPGRAFVGGGNSGTPIQSGNGAGMAGVGNSTGAIGSNSSNNDVNAPGAGTGAIYVPPYSGSTEVNPDAPVSNPFWNPQNNWGPTPPTVVGASHP